MATKLFDDCIFGPVKSRRLGISLGVNLLPSSGKLCNFNCIYCECGWTENESGQKLLYNKTESIIRRLEERLASMAGNGEPLDVITFAGNGEPTMHPDFPQIIDKTIELRNKYFPDAKIAVLSNATMIGKPAVREALLRIDRAILKIDSAYEETINVLNMPRFPYSLRNVVEQMKAFHGELIIQTMFLRGEYNGRQIDNTTEKEVSAWLEIIREINPRMVMIYTIARDTPAEHLHKISVEELQKIADRVRELGIECSVSG